MYKSAFSVELYWVVNYRVGLSMWPSGKESTCNAEDTGLIPSVGRSHMPQSTKPVGHHS